MAIRRLTSEASGALTYDQVGFDLMSMDHNSYGGSSFKEFYAGAGTDSGNDVYKNIPGNKTPHWVGIHNCGTVHSETCSIQAVSLVGDDLAKPGGVYNPVLLAAYIELMPGDIVYGKFTQVALLKTSSGSPVAYVDILRLIRGV